ncbi:C40 family peptidase [Megasphaera elsdenii]|uniref:C40 family peptidase n=1 Tax=Megasphaera elsdenii TaxID=907 RepID=UPI001D00A4AF|nr:NlpC/P60 family protein [Megasphaera elsdenii]MCB5701429.1 C40 family peptidase [Megasphaera elsdenii]MCB5726188.1 C40 family peptidase [Megasphaera elsdenii]MCB5770089.1 C40 family peptidase [Megasphaera elsdenii]
MLKYDDLIGIPYVDYGRDPQKGLDCWGLAMELYRRRGIQLPDNLFDPRDAKLIGQKFVWQRDHSPWHRLDQPEDGCLVVIRLADEGWANHCGVYIGYGEFIHAYHTSVVVDRVRRWLPRIVGFYDWVEDKT